MKEALRILLDFHKLDQLVSSFESAHERRAAFYAAIAHGDQKRKYTLEPYIVHPAEVARIVKTVPHTPEMVEAAWLHDVIEDCGVLAEDLLDCFTREVRDLVVWLTDVSHGRPENRATRKAMDLEHIRHAPAEAKTVKLADLISNSRDITVNDPKFAKVYLAEKDRLLEVLTEGDAELFKQAASFIRKEA